MDNLNCKKVESMLSLYIENKLTLEEKILIENHFIHCDSCYQKYLEMKKVMNNLYFEYSKMLDEFNKIESDKMFNIREYESFSSNISPYIDDELSYNDSIKFRRYLLKSKPARSELASAYNLKNNIRHSIAKFKDSSNINFSKKIIKKLKSETTDTFDKIYKRAAILLCLMVSALFLISLFLGFTYINQSYAKNNNVEDGYTVQMPQNEDDWVEFSFDENHAPLLTNK